MTHDFFIVPFKVQHLKKMRLQKAQGTLSQYAEFMESICSYGQGFTAFDGDTVLASAGMFEIWEGRSVAWAFLSEDATGKLFLKVHRAVKAFLDMQNYRRMEMCVLASFDQGRRWAEALGFKQECLMRRYDHLGQDHYLYARVEE